MARVKNIRIYDFRHSCDSLSIDSRANIILVVKYLGHTKLSYGSKTDLILLLILLNFKIVDYIETRPTILLEHKEKLP